MIIIALIIGFLYSISIYLMVHKSFFRLILGVITFSYASIFFLFTVCGIKRDAPPLFSGSTTVAEDMADPLPQALALTAIVISIGVQLFVIILLKKVVQRVDTDDMDDLRATDETSEKGAAL